MEDWRAWFHEAEVGGWEGTAARAPGPEGVLPLTPEMLRHWASGELFGLSQDVGMGWRPERVLDPPVLILSTQGGLKNPDGTPVALGYHTGHWEVDRLVRVAAETLSGLGALPFAAAVSDPCDGRSQGTAAMFDSLPYRNDAAQVMRRLIRSLPQRRGVVGVATCDKGLPATMMALASLRDIPGVLIPGGVTLLAEAGEDAGKVQSIGARFSHGELSLEDAARLGCRACASPGGGCQFLGTAATAQVVAEALGLAPPHSALIPSGQPTWEAMARLAARALWWQVQEGWRMPQILTDAAFENAMVVHAAFGGSTNLLLHLPAVAYSAGRRRPTVDDWRRVNQAVPRLVSVIPNGPDPFPTAYVYLAGGVPEVMAELRRAGLIDGRALTAVGRTWNDVLDEWLASERRQAMRNILERRYGVDPCRVIFSPDQARVRRVYGTLTFPSGNLAPEGAVVKSTALDPSVLDEEGVYRHRGPARVFTTEAAAIEAIKAGAVRPYDVVVLIGRGPLGTGMEETYQLTSALRYLSFGKHVALVTDARFSGVSTGACIGHVSPEGLAGGPIGKVRDGDLIEIVIDSRRLTGYVNLVGTPQGALTPEEAERVLRERSPHPDMAPDPRLPEDTKLWAALQTMSGGPWAGAVYDVEAILAALGDLPGLRNRAAGDSRPA
ncbi:MAG: YjhG/YagF family D-xylonate dehydratase [Firmicutes bacterium]|nr:YjhG/YagF family D-xylonate dehydratase [Bacillota bacterium]